MTKVTVFDTHYATDNIGDQIIMRSVMSNLHTLFPSAFFTGIPSHDYIGPVGRRSLKESDHSFIGGTNILSSHLLWYKQWKIRYSDLFGASKPVLMGVGWHKYESKPDAFTRLSYRYLLNKEVIHSVRDAYTFERLCEMGFKNVANTGCPTMWNLDQSIQDGVPRQKADAVVFTLTGYLPNVEHDRALIATLQHLYKTVYFWPQMHGDSSYLDSLEVPAVIRLSPNLEALENKLVSGAIDYVGLRLHCGIFALQHRVRSLTLIVDNRAAEIAKDTGLPAAQRDDLEYIESWIRGSSPVRLKLPQAEIDRWMRQFSGTSAEAGLVGSETGRRNVFA